MSMELLKSIRARTNLSYDQIKKAIAETASTDEEIIIAHLRKMGALKAQAREGRETSEGGIFSYIHEAKLGVMVEIKCETDFTSRNDSFKDMGNKIALHIAASNPKFVNEQDVDQDFIASELEIAREQLVKEGKPEAMMDKILDGKKNSIVKEFSLLSQPFLMDPTMTVGDYILTVAQATGEVIKVSRFTIYSLN
jgi:elongation factor Ts